MVGTPIILVQRPINPGLIIDLWIIPLCPKTSEMVKEQERKVEPPGIEPGPLAYRAIALPLSYSSHQQPPLIPFAISEVFGHNGMIQRSIIRPGLIGLWTKIIGVPTSCDSAQDFNDHNHTQLISYHLINNDYCIPLQSGCLDSYIFHLE